MKTLIRYTFLIALFCLFLGCKKSGNAAKNPCEGLINESPPIKIGIIVADKQTGNNLILANALKADDIKVALAQTQIPINNWRIVNSPNSPLNGMLELAVFHEKAGEYPYKMELKGLGDVNFSYSIKQQNTNNTCKPYYYSMDGLKALDKDFAPFKYGDKTYTDIITVFLD